VGREAACGNAADKLLTMEGHREGRSCFLVLHQATFTRLTNSRRGCLGRIGLAKRRSGGSCWPARQGGRCPVPRLKPGDRARDRDGCLWCGRVPKRASGSAETCGPSGRSEIPVDFLHAYRRCFHGPQAALSLLPGRGEEPSSAWL
jgi:hypothetical protein